MHKSLMDFIKVKFIKGQVDSYDLDYSDLLSFTDSASANRKGVSRLLLIEDKPNQLTVKINDYYVIIDRITEDWWKYENLGCLHTVLLDCYMPVCEAIAIDRKTFEFASSMMCRHISDYIDGNIIIIQHSDGRTVYIR